MYRLLDADPWSRMPGGASRLWVVVISTVVMAGTALPMVMSSDIADPVDSVAPAEMAQFAAAEEALTRAEATSGAVDVAPAGVAVAPPAVPTTSSQLPAKSPPKTLLPPLPSPRPPQAPPPSPETLLEKQKRLEKEAELLEKEREQLQQEHEQLKQAAESIRQRQRNLTIALQFDLCSMNSTFNVAPFCPFLYHDSEPMVGVDDTAYEINLNIPGLRKEDLTIRSEWGSDASVSEGVGNVLQIIGRTANVNMDVGIARAVRFYNDADWGKGLNITHSDGHLRIRVARRSSASRPMWSTWQIPGHLPESQLDDRLYDISERLKGSIEGHYRYGSRYGFQWLSVVLPAMQWFAQAPERALAWWFNKYKHTGSEYDQKLKRYVTKHRHPFDLINGTKTDCQNAIFKFSAAKKTCASRRQFPFSVSHNVHRHSSYYDSGPRPYDNPMLKCSDGWIESIADFQSANAVVEAIDEHLSKTIKNIEESGGYNIIVSTKILDGTMYKIDKNGVQYRQQTFPSFGNWWSKDVKITRQDGLDVIFIPIK